VDAPFAEVIGDPIAQSKSPLIHRRWLGQLGLAGDYHATRVPAAELAPFLSTRRGDPNWRGCNVTIPHKERVIALIDRLEPGAEAIGAVNCVTLEHGKLIGRNTDIDGVAAAFGHLKLRGAKAAMIGAGGGARAAFRYFLDQGVAAIAIVVRDPAKAAAYQREAAGTNVEIRSIDDPEPALEGAAAIVNASPLGMAGSPPMPPQLLDALAHQAHGAALLDMVYKPICTDFLRVGEGAGGTAVDGLVMLVGQARAAFQLFFGHAAPEADESLRDLLSQ